MTQPPSSLYAHDSHGFSVRSSFAAEVCDLNAWRDAHDDHAAGYEWWYFDAVSDDGRNVIVIIFLANFVFSPRYNRYVATSHENSKTLEQSRFPAVAFTLYRDGRPLIRAIQEYDASDFQCDEQNVACQIGANKFELINDQDGRVYQIQINLPLRRNRHLRAELRWSIVNGNLLADQARTDDATLHQWNLVAPRCMVTGDVNISDGAQSLERIGFAGVGYHDHNRDRRWMPEAFDEWRWGRAHFKDHTAVFYRYAGKESHAPLTRLFLVEHRTNALLSFESSFIGLNSKRNIFGLSFDKTIELRPVNEANNNAFALKIDKQQVIDASFFYLRFRGAATLNLSDGASQTAPLISEYLRPHPLANRALWWLINMRVGKNDRHSFLP